MQIFFLSFDPQEAAQSLCDKHCFKMVTETAQILSTVWKISNPVLYEQFYINGWLYKPFHNAKHPSIRWVAQSCENYWFTVWLLIELCQEYNFRYGKVHYCTKFIQHFVWDMPGPSLPDIGFIPMTPEFQAIPIELKNDNAVEAYKTYYLREKMRFAVWKKGRAAPDWTTKLVIN